MSTSYRVEISPNSRAGCQDTQCKKAAVKIQKNELRFGTWVEVPNYPGSWKWKHWGCVSGKQLENLRDAIEKGENEYDFDLIDGYDEMEGDHAEEFQEKIRTAMIEGKIADEDFKGDPEFNVLGQPGIRARAPRTPKAKAGEEEEEEHGENGQASSANTPAPKKRGRGKKAVDDEDDENSPPAKKSKTAGGKKKAVKAEDDEDAAEPKVEQPSKKSRAKKVKDEPRAEDEDGYHLPAAPEKPKRKPSSKKAAKVEPAEERDGNAAEAEVEQPAASEKPKRKRHSKKAAKANVIPEDVTESVVDEANGDAEPAEEAEAEPEVAPKSGGRKKRGKKSS